MFAEFAPLHSGLLALIVARKPLRFNGPDSRDTYNWTINYTNQTSRPSEFENLTWMVILDEERFYWALVEVVYPKRGMRVMLLFTRPFPTILRASESFLPNRRGIARTSCPLLGCDEPSRCFPQFRVELQPAY